jgi:hypothetical protein
MKALTVTQARNRVCPYAMGIGSRKKEDSVYDHQRHKLCVGDDCMAWERLPATETEDERGYCTAFNFMPPET